MNEGVIAELSELLALRQHAYRVRYRPEHQSTRVGNHHSKRRGRGMDFAEVRNYQSGDEIRHMEWRITARTGKPHVKLYQEERERAAILLIDFNPSMFFGTRLAFKSVLAARLAAMIAWTAVKQGDRVGGLLFSATEHDEFIPRSRESGILPMLSKLSQYTQTQDSPMAQGKALSQVLLRLRRVTRPGSLVILVSDFYQLNEECEAHLSRLRAHSEVLAYHICDPLELQPPKPQQYAITNGKDEFLLDTSQSIVRSTYAQYFEQRTLAIQDLFKRLNIQYTLVTSDQDIPQLVRKTYPRRISS